MSDLQLIVFLFERARLAAAEVRANPDRGDVAEKVVIVGVFVALAIAVGVIITKAVTTSANHVAHQIAP
jgi:hypothetical protein